MTGRPENKLETHFEQPGSLDKPQALGRIARFLFGAWLVSFLYQLIVFGPRSFVDQTPPADWTMWLAVGLGVMVTPYVVNIGFSQNWKQWPRVAVLGIASVLVALDLLAYGTWWAPPLGVFALGWFIYWVGHLGLSFVLSALIATPGCEMRAFPHLWTILTGRETREHYCPGFLDTLDRWERRRRSG